MTGASGWPELATLLGVLIERDGDGLLGERARLHGLLRDYAPNAVTEVGLLIEALTAGVVDRLQGAPLPISPEAQAREIEALAAAGCAPAAAEAAVSTWLRVVAARREPAAAAPQLLQLPVKDAAAAPSRLERLVDAVRARWRSQP